TSVLDVCFLSPGWQPRWFVLEDGVISYYDSEDDVGKGSKGSIKMSVCDIKGGWWRWDHPKLALWKATNTEVH
uniref:PH domain-containing protein n=1 Tax=Fundulus heteroclitus TaxID=8078 RepID=A0A3Q2T8F9_FUNHE